MSNEAERMADAAAAKSAMDRWLAPGFDLLRSEYIKKTMDLMAKPLGDKERAAITNLSIATRMIDVLQSQVAAVITDGDVARHDQRRAEQIAKINPEVRKLGIGWS